MALFTQNKKNGEAPGQADEGEQVKRDSRKAQRFFEHAQTVADARNYEYAIECYINGLRHDPDNMAKHEALHEVAMKRKLGGGKGASMKDRMAPGGSNALDKMLHVEKLWALDPLNAKLMRDALRRAVEADQEHDDLQLGEVVYWLGEQVLDHNGRQKKPDKHAYTQAKEAFKSIGRYDKAVDAIKRSLRQSPNDDALLVELKDLEAERTMQEGKYGRSGEDSDFRSNIKDQDKQHEYELEHGVSTESKADELIALRRGEYEEDPEDLDKLQKLIDALIRKETEAEETEAIDLLNKAWEKSGQYRYKMRAGDIQMKQTNRYLRQSKEMLQAAPDDEEVQGQYQQTLRNKVQFELQEYQERVRNYPTDLSLKFELGKRQYQTGQYDEAISMFQQAKADPKSRASAHIYLGQCYVKKDWLDEAMDTLKKGMEGHPHEDDRIALDLRYLYMDALTQSAQKTNNLDQAKESQKIASQILQTDINFRDIKHRVEQIKSLVNSLESK